MATYIMFLHILLIYFTRKDFLYVNKFFILYIKKETILLQQSILQNSQIMIELVNVLSRIDSPYEHNYL